MPLYSLPLIEERELKYYFKKSSMRKGKECVRKTNVPAWTIYRKWCEVVLNYAKLNLLQGTEHENSLNDSNAQELKY